MANKKIRNIIIIVLAVLVAAGIAVALFFLLPRDNDPADTDASSSAFSETVTSNESDTVDAKEESKEELKDGEFLKGNNAEQKETGSGELGGSSTVEIIKPETSSEETTSSENNDPVWIGGIW